MESEAELVDSINSYETQLSQIREHLAGSTNSNTSAEDVVQLKQLEADLSELVEVTRDQLESLQKCSELSNPDEPTASTSEDIVLDDDDDVITIDDELEDVYDLSQIIEQIVGMRCKATYRCLGPSCPVQYHNAVIMDVTHDDKSHALNALVLYCNLVIGDASFHHNQFTIDRFTKNSSPAYQDGLNSDKSVQFWRCDQKDSVKCKARVHTANDKALVLYCNPVITSMKPCNYFLEGNCNFEDRCKFSHGYSVPLDDVLEYVEPDFGHLHEGCVCLVKCKNDLWKMCSVTSLNVEESLAAVKLLETQEEIATNYEHLWPLYNITTEPSSNPELEERRQNPYDSSFSQNTHDANRIPSQVGAWEEHTKGIGSKLMLAMGYKYGQGLGKSGSGIADPIEVKVLPKGKSLDHIMQSKEGKGDAFRSSKAIRKQKRKESMMKKKLQKDYLRDSTEAGIFDFLNRKLGKKGGKSKTTAEKMKEMKQESCESLNLQSFKLNEERKKLEKSLKGYRETLNRSAYKDPKLVTILNGKAEGCQKRLEQIRLKELRINREQADRSNLKKSTIF